MNDVGCDRPRILIAGAYSGVGKSTITLALVAALRQRGLKVQTFKVGPDYLDPSHLAYVSGRPCFNLDGWMTNKKYVTELFSTAAADADISLIEGVMGLFDGSSNNSLSGSSAEIATWLQTPVALVVNTHGMARSIAALVKGYNEFDPKIKLAGVLANKCGSPSHATLLDQALQSSGQPPLLGAIKRDSLPTLASRHLGLISAAEQRLDDQTIAKLATAAESQIDIDLLLRSAQLPEPLPPQSVASAAVAPNTEVRLAVARDEAFQFYYPDLFTALKQRGCLAVPFSPLYDARMPDNIDGLYLGGGYPEVHAQTLAQNQEMLRSVRTFCNSGKPVYAECGGLIYLAQGVEHERQRFPLVGTLPFWTRMLDKRKALGYIEATLQNDSLFGPKGETFCGHEFHYSERIEPTTDQDGWQAAYQLKQNRTGNYRAEGHQKGNIIASYAHLHLASKPAALNHFIKKMKKTSDRSHSDR